MTIMTEKEVEMIDLHRETFRRHGMGSEDIDFSYVKPEAITAMAHALTALERRTEQQAAEAAAPERIAALRYYAENTDHSCRGDTLTLFAEIDAINSERQSEREIRDRGLEAVLSRAETAEAAHKDLHEAAEAFALTVHGGHPQSTKALKLDLVLRRRPVEAEHGG